MLHWFLINLVRQWMLQMICGVYSKKTTLEGIYNQKYLQLLPSSNCYTASGSLLLIGLIASLHGTQKKWGWLSRSRTRIGSLCLLFWILELASLYSTTRQLPNLLVVAAAWAWWLLHLFLEFYIQTVFLLYIFFLFLPIWLFLYIVDDSSTMLAIKK